MSSREPALNAHASRSRTVGRAGGKVCVAALVAGVLAAATADADVTVAERTVIDAQVTKVRLNSVERTSADRRRRDVDGNVEGPLAFLLGAQKSAAITRLDRGVEWQLELDNKRYRESPLPGDAERDARRKQLAALTEHARQCVAEAPTPDANPSCEPADPKFVLTTTSEQSTIAGHPTHKVRLTMTYTCKEPKTSSSCDYVATNDVWLTDDTVPGIDERHAFTTAYASRTGIAEDATALAAPVQVALGPYLAPLHQIGSHTDALTGTALRTTLSLSVSGAQCSSARGHSSAGGSNPLGMADAASDAKATGIAATEDEANNAMRNTVGNAVSDSVAGHIVGSAAASFGSKMFGGLLHRTTDSRPVVTSAAASQSAAPTRALLSLTTEIVSVSTAPIAAESFNVPSGWTRLTPKANAVVNTACPGADR